MPDITVTRSDAPAPAAAFSLAVTAEAEVIPAATTTEEDTP